MSDTPETPKKKVWWKRPIGMVIGLIGLIASTSSVVGLVMGWLNPEPSLQDVVEKQEDLAAALGDSGHTVNQVSTHVTKLGDQYQRILAAMKDVRRLDKSLGKYAAKGKILTPAQRKRLEASHEKEVEELHSLIDKTVDMAEAFVDSFDSDDLLSEEDDDGAKTASLKSRAKKQAQKVKDELLPELERIRDAHEG